MVAVKRTHKTHKTLLDQIGVCANRLEIVSQESQEIRLSNSALQERPIIICGSAGRSDYHRQFRGAVRLSYAVQQEGPIVNIISCVSSNVNKRMLNVCYETFSIHILLVLFYNQSSFK